MAPHIHRILDLARWAPSGDNTQPWRFEIVAEDHILVHGHDTRTHCVYDLDGHASQIAHGALLETLVLAAATEGFETEIRRREDSPETAPIYDVRFSARGEVSANRLAEAIERRTVQRRPMSARPIGENDKSALADSVPDYRLMWFESFAQRLKLATFMAANAKNRLTMPEAYPTHRDVIEWNARFSEDRIPEQAVGVDPLTARLMHWALGSWDRVTFLNTWLAGTVMPRVQLDLLPGLRCGAHIALLAPRPPSGIDDYVAAGRALQRMWLTATTLGLCIQPEMTPVIFSRYVRENRPFTQVETVHRRASRLAAQMDEWLGEEGARRTVFMGRLGYGPEPWSRSLRKPLSSLLSS